MIESEGYMKRKRKTVLFASFLFAAVSGYAQQLAFPGAQGYGRFASGGRGNGTTGRVII